MRHDYDEEESEWDGDDDDTDCAADEEAIEPTLPCPHCRRPLPEDAFRCPYCENYLSREDVDQPAARKPWWIIVGVILCLFAVYCWITS